VGYGAARQRLRKRAAAREILEAHSHKYFAIGRKAVRSRRVV